MALAETTIAGAAAPPSSAPDPLRNLLARLDQSAGLIARNDPGLAKSVASLVEAGVKPGQVDSPIFRTRLAYAVQDVERLVGPVLPEAGQLREEMSRRATSYPGLLNERVQDLLRQTPALEDRGLRQDIRRLAADTVKVGPNQDTPELNGRAEALEHRGRLAQPDVGARAQQSPGGGTPGESGGASRQGSSTVRERVADMPEPSPEARQAQRQENHNNGPSRGPTALERIVSAMAQAASSVDDVLKRPPTPMADRHASFRDAMQGDRDEKVIKGAEAAGNAATAALQAFSNGPGASVLSRIQDAAKADPDGMRGVMSGMREGGKYEQLRQQFLGEKENNKAFAAGYDKAAAAVDAYGQQREAVDQIGARRGDAHALNGRFEQLDAKVGLTAAVIPGAKEGKSMIDELVEKVREIVEKAVAAVKRAFTASPSAGPSAQP